MLSRARNRISVVLVVPAFVLASAPARCFEEVWRAGFRPSPGGPEEGLIAAGDGAGNLYVAGTARSLDDSTYYGSYTVTLKYAPDGDVLWTQYLHSEFSTRPVSLSVDAKGAVYVAASWEDDDVDNRARIFKVDAEGREAWENAFRGVPREDDSESTADPADVVHHSDGGAFLLCNSSDGRAQYSVVIRYGSDGSELWRAERPGGYASVMASRPEGGVIIAGASASGILLVGYGEDGSERLSADAGIGISLFPRAIAVAPSGTLHVAGSGTVVKLDPAGSLLGWATVAYGETERIAGLALLSGGEVVVAGSAGPWRERAGFVVKLDSESRSLWRADFGGREVADVRDMAVGPDGIVHLAGSIGTSGSRDYWTAALDASGSVLGERRRDGGGDDVANALAVDPAGNVHLTGASFGRNSPDMLTVKYDPAGNERWASRFEHPEKTHVLDVRVDGEGNTFVAGASGNNGNLLRYDATGAILWAVDFPHESEDEDAYGLALDASGSSFIAARDLRKLDPGGKTLWIRGGPPWYRSLERAPGGELYVAGWDFGGPPQNRQQAVFSKLDPAGRELWRRSFPGRAISDLALDAQGLPVLALRHDEGGVRKYDADGEILWSAALPEELRFSSRLDVDASGNVYALGVGIRKLDPRGNQLWSRLDGSYLQDMALDGAGNVHAFGADETTPFVVKLTPRGEEAWKTAVQRHGFRIDVDAAGSAFISGVLPGGGDDPDLYFVTELDPGGRIVDHVTFGPAYCCTTAPRLAFHPGGDLIVAAPSDAEYLTLRLRRSGASEFSRGDATGDGALLIDDAIVSLDWLFRGGPEPGCADAADSNDDGLIDITDAVYTLGHLFLGGPSPPPPYPGRGRDPTPDLLSCRR